jgi:hypothetical protein
MSVAYTSPPMFELRCKTRKILWELLSFYGPDMARSLGLRLRRLIQIARGFLSSCQTKEFIFPQLYKISLDSDNSSGPRFKLHVSCSSLLYSETDFSFLQAKHSCIRNHHASPASRYTLNAGPRRQLAYHCQSPRDTLGCQARVFRPSLRISASSISRPIC